MRLMAGTAHRRSATAARRWLTEVPGRHLVSSAWEPALAVPSARSRDIGVGREHLWCG
jgi:hypothetical protein